jgi:hypothetical protein
VTAPDSSWGHDAAPSVRALFTVSDPFGLPITAYQFKDMTSDPTSGYFVVNGVAQGALQVINVTAAQLGQTTFQTGWGTDDLFARAFDGTAWGAWQEFHVTAPVDTGPVVTAANLITASGQIFAASNLFKAKDPFGDAIAQYDLSDNGAGGGHFVLNGQALAANQDNYLTAAQLAQTTYQGGTGSDTLQVRANEVGQWSAWASFTVTTTNTIGAGMTLELASSFSGGVTFAANTGTLLLDNSSSFSGSVSGFSSLDKFDLADITAGPNATLGYSGTSTNGTLTVSDGTHMANIALLGQYSAAMFVVSSDQHGGTLVSDTGVAAAGAQGLLAAAPG